MHDVQLVREAGYGGQDLIYLAVDRRGGRDVCRQHTRMYDELAVDLVADTDTDDVDALLMLVEVTVWADQADSAQAEIDAVWAVAS